MNETGLRSGNELKPNEKRISTQHEMQTANKNGERKKNVNDITARLFK